MIKTRIFVLLLLVAGFSKVQAQGSMESNVKSMEDAAKPVAKKYDKILSVSPIQFTENGVGFAVSFEQRIDRDGIVSYNLPLVASYNLSRTNSYGQNNSDPMYYFMPGLKFYPTGSKGKVKYAVGPSLVAGVGKIYRYSYSAGTDIEQDKFLLGVTINNSLNINVTKNIYAGMDLGLGFTYIRKYDGIRQTMGGLANGGFKIGFRF